MKRICDDLRERLDELNELWTEEASGRPWFVPPRVVSDALPEVVVGLVHCSLCEPQDLLAHKQWVVAASQHGESRRERGDPAAILFQEYQLLRRVIWAYLRDRFGATRAVEEALVRIDAAITLATSASLWGYHRPEVEQARGWRDALDSLVRASPLLRSDRERERLAG